jgi:hypothetical protein
VAVNTRKNTQTSAGFAEENLPHGITVSGLSSVLVISPPCNDVKPSKPQILFSIPFILGVSIRDVVIRKCFINKLQSIKGGIILNVFYLLIKTVAQHTFGGTGGRGDIAQ